MKKLLAAVLFAGSVLGCIEESTQEDFFQIIEKTIEGASNLGCLTKCCESLKSRPAMHYTYY